MSETVNIIVTLSKGQYEALKDIQFGGIGSRMIFNAIKNGIPLPKGHGDLIDKSKIYKAIYAEEDNCTGMGMTLEEMNAYNDGIDAMYSIVQGKPAIIQADKAESEEV